jgi:hypothetical protein
MNILNILYSDKIKRKMLNRMRVNWEEGGGMPSPHD